MALDNAEFISELSILDPPGTDPLNQGDDHIRTVKKAVQQSFPNVGSAVPQTGVQMAQMAIKNEANTFTQINTFSNSIRAFNGTTLLPSYSFTSDPAMGMYFAGINLLGFSIATVTRMTLSVNGAEVIGELKTNDGLAATPAHSFNNSNNMGMYRIANGILGFAPSGTEQLRMTSVFSQFTGQIRATSGSAAAPGVSFSSSTDAGMYRFSSTAIAFAQSGVTQLILSTQNAIFSQATQVPDGTEAFPGYAFSNLGTGFFAASNAVTAVVGGTAIWAMSTNGMFSGVGFVIHADGGLVDATRPGFSFDNDTDTGVYRASANVLGLAAGGLSALQLGNGGLFAGNGFVFQAIGESTPNKPGYTFSNDSDTGMFRTAANALGFATGGVKRFELTSTGRILADSTTMELRSTANTVAASYQLKPGGILFFEMASGTLSNAVWSLVRYSNGGAFLGLPLQVERLTGTVLMPDLSTTNPGGSGRLWKNGNVVNIT